MPNHPQDAYPHEKANDLDSGVPGPVPHSAIGDQDGHRAEDNALDLIGGVHRFDWKSHTHPLFKARDRTRFGYFAAFKAVCRDRFVISLFSFAFGAFYSLHVMTDALSSVDVSQLCTTVPAASGK